MRPAPALVLLILAACGQPAPTWHRDVAPIVQRKCATCHEPGGIAPFSLVTLDDWRKMEPAALDAIAARRMPPFPARLDCAQYQPVETLSDAQRATIERWVATGGAVGNAADFVPLTEAENRLTRVDLSLPMKEPFTPTKSPDEYRCFLIDWPFDAPTYITGYELRPGRKELLHHADLFYLNPEVIADWQARDDADPRPGWECYSIPLGQEGGWIGTFVPGNRGVDFPAGTGLRIRPGSKVFLQMHYNTASAAAAADLSTLDLRIESRVRRPAAVQALSDPSWLTKKTMLIPAGQKDVTHRFRIDPTPFLSVINNQFVDGQPVKIYATTMHMHQLGTSSKLEILRADGGTDCVVDIPKWDFHWQLPYTLREPLVVNPGDQLSVECTWDNTAGNQPVVNGVQRAPVDRNWGSRTEDEMCVAGIYASQ